MSKVYYSLMESINIFLTGLPNVGKSTLTNSLIGAYLSKKNTLEENVFVIDPKHIDIPMTEVINDIKYFKLKQYKNNLLPKDCKVTIHDTVGVNKKISYIKKHSTVINFNEDINECDILITVIDINTMNENLDRNLKLLEETTKNLCNSTLHICVINKCDTLVYRENNYSMEPTLLKKFNDYKKILNNNGYFNIVPLCAYESMFFSNGSNEFFESTEQYYKDKYLYDSENGNKIEYLLTKYGLKNLANIINDFVNNKKDSILNRHILNKIKSCDSLDQYKLSQFMSNLINNNDDHISELTNFVHNKIDIILLEQLTNVNKLNKIKESFDELSNTFKEKTGYELNCADRMSQISCELLKKHHLENLLNHWDFDSICELYRMNELDENIFRKSVMDYITEKNVLDSLLGVLIATSNNVNYFFATLDIFLEKFPNYVILFKNSKPLPNSMFELVRLQLLHIHSFRYDEQIKLINLNVELFDSMTQIFNNFIDKCMYELNRKIKTNDDLLNTSNLSESIE